MPDNRYYREFAGETFVIQAECEAVDDLATTRAIVEGIDDLLRHRIRVVLVFGKAAAFESELRAEYGASVHPETNRLAIPETALPRIRQERARIAEVIRGICGSCRIAYQVIDESAVRVERRIGHGSTGVPTRFDLDPIRTALDDGQLAVVGFGGRDDGDRFLHVPSISLSADLAVALGARKLLFLTAADGLTVPDPRKARRLLSFADLEQLLCLLQRRDDQGRAAVDEEMLPKVHASIRAVAGGVHQVHLVCYARLLDEILTRTGVGTMVERRQSHHVDYARPEDLDEIERLHGESQRFRSEASTPFVKPLDREALGRLLPDTLLLRHRDVLVGKLHTTEAPDSGGALQIGGFVIAENHQDSQQGQLLLGEAFARMRDRGCTKAVAITASERAQGLFTRVGGRPVTQGDWQIALLERASARFTPAERAQLKLFEFPLE